MVHASVIVAYEAEAAALYRQMPKESRTKLCSQFKDADDGRFRYNPDVVNQILVSNGINPVSSRDSFKYVEQTCRHQATDSEAGRHAEEVRFIIRDRLNPNPPKGSGHPDEARDEGSRIETAWP